MNEALQVRKIALESMVRQEKRILKKIAIQKWDEIDALTGKLLNL